MQVYQADIFSHLRSHISLSLSKNQINAYFIEKKQFIILFAKPCRPHLSLSAISKPGIVLFDEKDRLILGQQLTFELGVLQGSQHSLEVGPGLISHILQIGAGQ